MEPSLRMLAIVQPAKFIWSMNPIDRSKESFLQVLLAEAICKLPGQAGKADDPIVQHHQVIELQFGTNV